MVEDRAKPSRVIYWLQEFRPAPGEEKFREYRVEVLDEDGDVLEEYSAGNSRFESQTWVPISEGLDRRTMRKFAKETAERLAAEHGLTPADCYKGGDELDG